MSGPSRLVGQAFRRHAAAALLAVALVSGPVNAAIPRPAAAPAPGTAAYAALVEFARILGVPDAGAVAARFGGNSSWEVGTLTVPGEDPQPFLYVAQRGPSGWTAAVEGTDVFAGLVEQGSAGMAGTSSAALLLTAQGTAAGGSARLSLPWPKGQTWRLTGGPHNTYGAKSRPWSAIDLAGPVPKTSSKVVAARGGIVLRPCKNMVQIRHGRGWSTSYYHLKDIRVRAGDRVDRGDVLGWTSVAAGCGGYATAPHVHFSLMRQGSPVPLDGHTIGGWSVRDGPSQYLGCLAKNGVRRCAPSGSVYNSGIVGDS